LLLGHAPADDPIDHGFDHGGEDALTLEAAVASRGMVHARAGRYAKRSGRAAPQGFFHFQRRQGEMAFRAQRNG
jgi:hypothetical protein